MGAFLLGEKQAHHVLGILFWVVQWWFYYYYYFFNPWNGQSPFSGLKVIWIFLSLLMLAQHVWEVHGESACGQRVSFKVHGSDAFPESSEQPQALLRLVLDP